MEASRRMYSQRQDPDPTRYENCRNWYRHWVCNSMAQPHALDYWLLQRIWLLDLAGLLPKTVQLDGFDVSDSQYPCPSLLPQNVQLNVLDAFGDVPHQLESKYDIVHLRFWCCVVRGDDPSRLMRHVLRLLSKIYKYMITVLLTFIDRTWRLYPVGRCASWTKYCKRSDCGEIWLFNGEILRS